MLARKALRTSTCTSLRNGAAPFRGGRCTAGFRSGLCPLGGQTRSFAKVGSVSGLPESGHGLGSFYSSRFLMIAELASSMSQVQVDQKTYQMPPQDGFTVAYFLTVADIERSARFYET